MAGAAVICSSGARALKHKTGIIGIAYDRVNNYSTENPYNLASLKRGTGGRSSFNGIVATVFGSSGFIGRYVCNRLGKIGTQMILPYRCDPYEMLRLRLTGDLGQVLFHPFELRDEESIRKAMRYSNVVINLIGRDWETKNFKFRDVHVEGARTLARIAREMGVERFIHVSALNAEEHPKGHLISRGSKFLASKWEGEQVVFDEFPQATVFRPSDVYGQEDRFLRLYASFLRRQFTWMPLYKKGEHTIKQPVYVSDLAAGIVNACRDPDTCGKVYQAVGPRRYYLSELVDWFYRVMNRSNEWGYLRYDMRLDPTFSMKVMVNELISAGAPFSNLHWERLERECVTDVVDDEIPTLEDLGVHLTKMEDQVPWELKPFRYAQYYTGVSADDPVPTPEPPKHL